MSLVGHRIIWKLNHENECLYLKTQKNDVMSKSDTVIKMFLFQLSHERNRCIRRLQSNVCHYSYKLPNEVSVPMGCFNGISASLEWNTVKDKGFQNTVKREMETELSCTENYYQRGRKNFMHIPKRPFWRNINSNYSFITGLL